ncbi:MAG: hypothetical protein ACK6A7_00260 [Planctomycetota bacterium]
MLVWQLAVGYKEPLAFLAGELSKEEMIEQVKAHTRQFVRRQEIWFRSMPGMEPIVVSSDSDLSLAAGQMELSLKDR